MRILLDTHMLINWCSAPDRLSSPQKHAVLHITEQNPAIVAGISLWEIAMLVMLRRVELDYPVREWLNRATAPPLVRVAPITAAIAGELLCTADWENRDPADRIIVATARVYGAHIMSNDELIKSSRLAAVV